MQRPNYKSRRIRLKGLDENTVYRTNRQVKLTPAAR